MVGRTVVLLVVLLACLLEAPVAGAGVPSERSRMPSQGRWLADVRAAMAGARPYVGERLLAGGDGLALNLDIDNTALATFYADDAPVLPVLRLARYASARGVAVLFNTGRNAHQLHGVRRGLRAAGYPVTEICHRRHAERVAAGKRRCRRHFVREGYTLIANVGNSRTDFVGRHYERRFRLPDYGNRLS